MLRKTGPSLVMFLCIAFLLAALSFHPAAQSQKNTAEFERLAQRAWREGAVPVIVRIDVPGITELTSASVSSTTVDGPPAAKLRMATADAQLRAAIDATTQAVVSELQGTTFTLNRQYSSIPFVALRVSTGAIEVLQASSRVLGIEEDVAIPLDPEEAASARSDTPVDASHVEGGDRSRGRAANANVRGPG